MKPAETLQPGDKEYFASWFRLQQRDLFLIWIRMYDSESVVVNEQGYIPIFSSEMALAAYAKANGFEIVDEAPILHNLDAVEEWLQQPQSPIDCDVCLSAWNFFTDAANGLQVPFSGDKQGNLRNRIYDKLYFGNNHFVGDPILGHPSGQFYIPQWNLKEKEKIVKILTQGLEMFKSRLLEIKN